MPRIDLITPAYNEEEVIDLFLDTIIKVIDGLPGHDFRIILVNDGSRDRTLDKLRAWQQREERLEVLTLSRNFGHESALAAGLNASRGDACIVLDADLQDPPSLIAPLIQKWQEGYEVVNAYRSDRKDDSFMKRWTAKRFYRFINSLSGKIEIPENVGNCRLLSSKVRDLLNQLPEKNRVFRVLIPFLGFPTAQIPYARPPRGAGATHYNWSSMIRLAVDGITSATTIPLKLAINVGLFVSGTGFAYMLYVMYLAIFTERTVQGWPSMMSVVLFMGGIQLFFLGVLGEYIGRIFQEVKSRPDHIVAKHWRARRDEGDDAKAADSAEGRPPRT
jgi:dolichol-phosphate mannosyltransferase